jgi:galactose oxidase-like protein/Kelch motif protein
MRPLLKTSHQAWSLPVSGSALPAQAVAALGLVVMACSPASEFSPEPGQERADVRLSEAATLATSGWNPVAPMNQPRKLHTATLLQDGLLLVVGGGPGTSASSSAELYDPATQTWSMTGSLSVARAEHTATLLPDGKVLVVGGYNSSGDTLDSSEVYDPVTRTWSLTSTLPQARRSHTATALQDGKVLVVGGYADPLGFPDIPLASYEVYDPATGMWSAGGSLNRGYASHTATLLPDGKVFIMGDSSYESPPSEVYDPATGTSSLTSLSAQFRRHHTATLLPNGTVLVVGEPLTEVYDPATNTWYAAGSLYESRRNHTATLLSNGTVLVVGGGQITREVGWWPLPSTEVYDPSTQQWLVGPRLAEGRSHHSATLLKSGQVLITGGKTFYVSGISSSELFTRRDLRTTLSAAPPHLTHQAIAAFSFSANETGLSFVCSLDSASFQPCTSPLTTQPLSEGPHTLRVQARDSTGNVEAPPVSHSWTVDLTPPNDASGCSASPSSWQASGPWALLLLVLLVMDALRRS